MKAIGVIKSPTPWPLPNPNIIRTLRAVSGKLSGLAVERFFTLRFSVW